MSLSVSDLVRVTVNLSPLAAGARSFGVLMIAGDSDVISGAERFRTYTTIDGVVADFGVNAPEAKAAALYFGQTPKPKTLMVGRWFRTASSAENIGGILTAQQALLTNWTVISNGGFDINIDGVGETLTGLDFTSAANLNAVANIITTALSGAGTCLWTGTNFVIESITTGPGVKATGSFSIDPNNNLSYGVQASGTITLSGQPSNGDHVVIKGTTVTFVSGTPSGNEVQISGVDDLHTAANLQAFLQASSDVNLAACTYNTIGLITTITAKVFSTSGNSYSLTKSGSNIAVSGSGDLAGGLNPDTVTLNGTQFSFVKLGNTGGPAVGTTPTATIANLLAAINADPGDTNLNVASYSASGVELNVTYKTAGTNGNNYTLATVSTYGTVSGGNLTGGTQPSSVSAATTGSGTDISAQLKMTTALYQALVAGYDEETPAACAAVLANKSAAWYGLMFQASTQPTDDENIDVSSFTEALDLTRIFGVTITDTNVLSDIVTTDLASRMKAAGYLQSFCQYSSNAYAIASFFGRAFSVDFNANRTTITLMYKQEPGVTGEDLTENEALTLKTKRCNVFVNYVNDTMIIQFGVMSGAAYFDEIHGLDWLQNAVQTACFNVLYTSTTKVPQTDQGVNQLTNAISGVCTQAVDNGLVAPGTWTADGFGQLTTGQFLKTGFYIFATPIALQSQSDRETRVAPPIQVAVKLAGAIQSLDVLIDVNR